MIPGPVTPADDDSVSHTMPVLSSDSDHTHMPTYVCMGNVGGLPMPHPWVFTGDPLQYPVWRSAFETLI